LICPMAEFRSYGYFVQLRLEMGIVHTMEESFHMCVRSLKCLANLQHRSKTN
jgi:hypothetical protein